MFIPFWCASKMSISIMPKFRQPELELFVCPRAMLLANGNTRLRIVAVTFGRFLKRSMILIPHEASPGNGLLLFFRVDDFNMALKRARALVTRLEEEPHVNPNTQTREFSLRDPEGYYVTISALSAPQRKGARKRRPSKRLQPSKARQEVGATSTRSRLK